MVHKHLLDGVESESLTIPVTRSQLTAIIVLLVLAIVGGVSLAYFIIGGDAYGVSKTTRREIKNAQTEQLNVGVLVAPTDLKHGLLVYDENILSIFSQNRGGK